MKRILFLLLSWLIPLTSFSFTELFINECKTDVYFGNGILTEQKDAVHLVPNEDVWNEYIFINSINIHSYAGAWERDLNMNLYI